MAQLKKEVKKYVKSYQTQKGARWKVVLPDGRGGQIREGGFIEESHAMSFACTEYTKVLLNKNKLGHLGDSKITVSEYAHQWLDMKARNDVESATARRYGDLIKGFINPFFGAYKLQELEKVHLRNYISELQRNKVSTYNVNSSVTLLKMILRQAIEDDYMPMSGILSVRTPKHKAKEPRFWDQKEMNFFLNAASESKWIRLWRFTLWTGMRAGEVSALKWDCVHLDMKSGAHIGFIKVCRTCAQKTCEIRNTTKNGENRMVPIFPELRILILEMKQGATGPFVFGGHEPLEPSHFSRLLQKDLKKIPQLPQINFHSLRHTFCSYIDSTGMNRRIVAEIMGHKDLSTTDRYSHVSNQTLGLEVNRWIENKNKQNPNNICLLAL